MQKKIENQYKKFQEDFKNYVPKEIDEVIGVIESGQQVEISNLQKELPRPNSNMTHPLTGNNKGYTKNQINKARNRSEYQLC